MRLRLALNHPETCCPFHIGLQRWWQCYALGHETECRLLRRTIRPQMSAGGPALASEFPARSEPAGLARSRMPLKAASPLQLSHHYSFKQLGEGRVSYAQDKITFADMMAKEYHSEYAEAQDLQQAYH